VNVSLRQLECFLVVADRGSFTRVGAELTLAQSAVSLLVRELEAELGIKLFDRTTRRVELTDAGREFRVHAQKLMADLDYAVRNVQDLVARKRGRLVVAAPPLLAATLVPQAVARFRRDYPGVQVGLVDVPTDQILARVRSGEADLGIGTFAGPEEGLDVQAMVEDELQVFCPARHPLLKRAQVGWRDLRGEKLIGLSRASGIRALIDGVFERLAVPPSFAFEVAQITTALALVEAGLGVAVLPSLARLGLKARGVASRPLADPAVTRAIALITRSGRTLPPALPEFMRLMTEHTRKTVGT